MRRWDDDGNAVVEFVFLAVLFLVPLTYLLAAVAVVQRSTLAVSSAARNAGRAFATSDTSADARRRVTAAVRLALTDQGLPDDATVRFVAPGRGCDADALEPQLVPGAVFAVCVIRHVDVPGVPAVLSGRGIRVVGEYVVHVDDFRTVG